MQILNCTKSTRKYIAYFPNMFMAFNVGSKHLLEVMEQK